MSGEEFGQHYELKGPSYRQRKAVTIVSGFHVPGFELKPKLGTRNRIEVVHDPARRLLPLGGSREGGSHKKEAGADAVFVEAPESKDEMKEIARLHARDCGGKVRACGNQPVAKQRLVVIHFAVNGRPKIITRELPLTRNRALARLRTPKTAISKP